MGGGLGCSFPLGGDLVVPGVEALGLGTVKVEPPIADEVLLVEDGAVGAEEGLGGEAAKTIRDTNVESLATGVRVSVVA